MPSFGENLRREREKRKFTLDQISQSTKIGTRMLQALEDDKFNQLPGGIFNKGFVRAYARCIGLDEEQTVADYLQASGETPPVMPELPQERPERPRIIEAREDTPERPLPWGTFAALLLLAALALTLWSHRRKKEQAAAPQPLQTATTQAQPEPQPQLANQRPAATNSTPPVKVASPVSQPQKLSSASAPSTTPAAANPGIAPSPAPATGGFVIEINAREDSWTVITADGKTVYSGMLTAGDGRSIRGQKSVIVKAGNAGAVDIFFNGKRVPKIGEFGEIKTATFGPDGMTPNSPPPPPTTQ